MDWDKCGVKESDCLETCDDIAELVVRVAECPSREVKHTDGCGGAVYWWCNKSNKQINIYEDCIKCEDENIKTTVNTDLINEVIRDFKRGER